jgi:hypothetical protein
MLGFLLRRSDVEIEASAGWGFVTRFLKRLGPAGRAVRANLAPGLVLQAFALAIVLLYFETESVRQVLDGVGRFKVRWGYAFSALSTAFFGGLVPYLVLLGTGRVPRQRRVKEAFFYIFFWLYKGIEIDALYRLQAHFFGAEASWSVVVTKMTIDQLVYNPLWGAPSQTACFVWKDAGFSLAGARARLAQSSLADRSLVVLFSTWVVWLPAVAIIYSLPGPLQLPLFNLVLCFWCLLLSFVSREATTDASAA